MTGKPDGYYRAERLPMLDFVPRSARRVLDVGCAEGAFGAALRSRRPGTEVWGLEVEAGAAAAARRRLDGVVVGAYPEVIPDVPGRFDCIVFNDVLEHLVDPWTALGAAHRLVEPGGVVVASVPNVRNWRTIVDLVRHGRWDHTPAGVHDVDHLRWFTRQTVVEAFDGAGWEVMKTELVSPVRFPPARLLGTVLAPFAPGLRGEAGFKQVVVVARSAGTGG